MPVGNWNLEFLNHNSQRRYPLADTANGTDTSGSFTIPEDFIVELDLPIHAGLNVASGRFFIKRIDAYSIGYAVIVGYAPTDGDPVDAATALIPRQTFATGIKNVVFSLGGVSNFADTVGKIVIGSLTGIDLQPAGSWFFEFTAGQLDPDAIRPIISGVSSITLINGSQESAKFYGDVELVAGTNCQLVPILVGGDLAKIRINFIQGEGSIEDCTCYGDAALTTPIKTINGVPPTTSGGFSFAGTTCLQIEPITNGIKFVDTCANPCCGATELERITQDLERLAQQATNIEGFLSRLQISVQTMDMVVLGSRLNDKSCAT
jgi:hypothetical protein